MMQFKPFFKTTVGMKPQSEKGSSSAGGKMADTIKDEKKPTAKDKQQNPVLLKKGSEEKVADGMADMAASVKGAFGGGSSAPAPDPTPEADTPSLGQSITNGLNKLTGR